MFQKLILLKKCSGFLLKLRDPSSLGEKAYWLSSLSLFFRDSLDGARLGHKLVLEDDLGDVIVEAAHLEAANLGT